MLANRCKADGKLPCIKKKYSDNLGKRKERRDEENTAPKEILFIRRCTGIIVHNKCSCCVDDDDVRGLHCKWHGILYMCHFSVIISTNVNLLLRNLVYIHGVTKYRWVNFERDRCRPFAQRWWCFVDYIAIAYKPRVSTRSCHLNTEMGERKRWSVCNLA